MQKANWYFDFVSPFSYLQLGKVLQWRGRLEITPLPIVFGAVLKHLGSLGPAEIPGKRPFTYRFVQWQAEQTGLTLRFPPAHPFNPLTALRLCVAAGSHWDSIEAIFKHIWRDGRAAVTAAELADVAASIGVENVENATNDTAVKAKLRANTDQAIASGIFGVPTLQIGAEIFWGNDVSPMIEDYLDHPERFATDEYRRIAVLATGIDRTR